MYMTASWSGMTRSPWRTSVVAGVDDDAQLARLEDLLEAVGEFRPARAAGEDDDVHVARRAWTSVMRVDGLTVVWRGHPDDDRAEAHVAIRADRVGDGLGWAEEDGPVAHVGRAVGREQLPVPCLRGGRVSAG